MVRYLGKNLVLNSPEAMMIEGQEWQKTSMLDAKSSPGNVGNIMKDSMEKTQILYTTPPHPLFFLGLHMRVICLFHSNQASHLSCRRLRAKSQFSLNHLAHSFWVFIPLADLTATLSINCLCRVCSHLLLSRCPDRHCRQTGDWCSLTSSEQKANNADLF